MLTLVKDFHVQEVPSSPASAKPSVRHSEYNRRRFLASLPDEVAVLRAMGLDHRQVANLLDIDEHDVRALCWKPRERIQRRNLPRRAVEALLHGRHASLGGRTIANRSRHLIEIASAYTRDELLSEPGVGTVAVTEIELWLEERGAALRPADE